MPRRIEIRIPAEVAEEIVAQSDATIETKGRRSSWEIAIDSVNYAAVTISLLQTPQVLADLSRRISNYVTRNSPDSDLEITIEAIGPRGQLRIRGGLNDLTITEIEQLLQRTIF
jgi:hypothetical protein